MKLIITRHAQTKNNEDGIIHTESGGSIEITTKGFLEIKKLISRLKKEKIDRIICSNVERCKLTAKEIIQEIPLEIEYTSLIREKENGDFGGMKHNKIKWEDLAGTFETRKAPNGESLIETRERGRKFFAELLKKNDDKTILIISHGAFLKVLVGDLLNMSLHDSIFKLKIDHCSLTFVDIKDKENYNFKTINLTDFL